MKVSVHHLGGQTDFLVPQTTNGREWVYFDEFEFNKDATTNQVVITAAASGTTVANAVWLSRIGDGETILQADLAHGRQMATASRSVKARIVKALQLGHTTRVSHCTRNQADPQMARKLARELDE